MSGGSAGSGDKPPAIDQDGKMINPHNPEFITKVPWYLGNTGPTLKHHSRQKNNHELSIAETDALVLKKLAAQQEVQAASKKTTYRKGACKNCGAMTHQEKDCLERPRSSKKAAWKSGLDIAADEVVLNMENHGKLSYAAKRDQWKGYDPAEYQELIERHNRLEEEQRKALLAEKQAKDAEQRAQKQDRKSRKAAKRALAAEQKSRGEGQDGEGGESSGSDSDSDYSDAESDAGSEADNTDDAFKQKDAHARDFQGTLIPQGGVGGNGMRITARNLRIREDTPKYLRNLSLDSAFYDPKSRSMRANPYGDVANPETLPYAGDNFVRFSGDALQLAQNQVLCWEMQEKNGMTGGLESIDVISNPSQAELLQRTIVAKKAVVHEAKTQAIYEKYLGADYAEKKQKMAMDSRLKLGQTESYVEYSRDGSSIIKTNTTGTGAAGGAAQATSGLHGRPLSLLGKTTTKYEEDVLQFNHTTVWGSYFCRATASWGYACCHSSMKMAYCTGEKGKLANDLASQSNAVLVTRQQEKREEKQAKSTSSKEKFVLQNTNDLFGSLDARQVSSLQLDPVKLQAAESRARDKSHQGQDDSGDGEVSSSTKRGYNSMQSTEVTAEDMEVYRRKRVKNEDPMAHLLGSDELLER